MKLYIEKIYPYIGGLIISGIYFCYIRPSFVSLSICNLLSSVVSISAIAIGFLATSKSILFTIQDHRIIKQIKQSKLYDTLINYMMSAIHLCFLLALISALGLLIDDKNKPQWLPSAFAIWVFLGVTSMLACYRVINIFSKILRSEP